VEAGAIVVGVDNFFTGERRNVDHLLDHRQFEVIPPAELGALRCEPLEAAVGVADAAPVCVSHLKVAVNATTTHRRS
jgi:UDP-glucuronate decarboxylase